MKKRHHFFNMYLTTTISVMLVLVLVGLETVLLLSAHDIIRQVKENVALTLVLNDDADADELARLDNLLTIAPFCREHKYVSKDEALQSHIQNLGEDPSKFLGFNPLLASYEIKLQADYAQADSIDGIKQKLRPFACINRMVYQEDVVNMLDSNVNSLSVILLCIALILLFVAIALIVNTIRLYVYSKRFLINTMKLVGATPSVIKAPIVRRNIGMGMIAALLALMLLLGALFYCKEFLNITLLLLTPQNIVIVVAAVFFAGMFITLFASLFAANKYIRMKTDDLYYI